MTRTYLHHGDHIDIVEEEDVDPLTESLKKHVAAVNSELHVSFGCPGNIHPIVSCNLMLAMVGGDKNFRGLLAIA